MARLSIVVSVACVVACGCETSYPECMPMGPASPLLQSAKRLRLDVYEVGVACDGTSVAAGAPPPVVSKAGAPGQPLNVDVPPGRHALVLVAFADEAATQPIGSACVEQDFSAGAQACVSFQIQALPDASVAPCDGASCPCQTQPDSCPKGEYCAADGRCAPGCKAPSDCAAPAALCDLTQHRCVECLGAQDCPMGKRCSPSGTCVDGCDPGAGAACPSALMCCDMLCIDTAQDISSCGACGRTCGSQNVAAPGCAAGLCEPTCLTGFGNCNKPVAPNPDDGCETPLNTLANCGDCAKPCSLKNATAECSTGTCRVETCNANYFNCDGMHANGCECAVGNGCCPGGTCQTEYTDGHGHDFYDCTPAGTYSFELAKAAAAAYKLSGENSRFCDTDPCSNASTYYCERRRPGMVTQECVCWAFNGNAKGHTTHKNGECSVPTANDPAWGPKAKPE